MSLINKYIGDKQYYKQLCKIGVPLALSMLLQSCMSVVDTIMVSSIGMVTAVGNAGNIVSLSDGITWGVTSGTAIFAAQFYGANQKENMARTFGLCILLLMGNALIWCSAVYLFGNELLTFYLNDPEIVKYSLIYIRIEILSLIPSLLCFACSVMFRSEHNTKLPFITSVTAAISNVIFNYLFIFVFNMGVAGAALGTLLSCCLNLIVYIIAFIILKPDFFIPSKMFDIHIGFVKPVLETTLPIIINETFFGLGMSLFNKAYGMLGTKSMDAIYVANRIFELFTFAVWGFGSAVSIIVGTTLGKGEIEKAKKESRWQLGSAFVLGVVLSLLMAILTPFYVRLFNIIDPETYRNACLILYVFAFKILVRTFNYMLFSTLKAGGDSKVLNLYDSGFMYLIGLPLAFICAYSGMKSIALLILIVQLEQVIRLIFTLRRYNSYVWAKDLTKMVNV